jgi:hypothetical protein
MAVRFLYIALLLLQFVQSQSIKVICPLASCKRFSSNLEYHDAVLFRQLEIRSHIATNACNSCPDYTPGTGVGEVVASVPQDI